MHRPARSVGVRGQVGAAVLLGCTLLPSCRTRNGAAADSTTALVSDSTPAAASRAPATPGLAPAGAGASAAGSSAVGTPPTGAVRTASVDTARGTLMETGSEPNTMMVLQTADGTGIVLGGPSLALLRRVAGLEVMVEGTRTNERAAVPTPGDARVFAVERFVVRAADGVPAVDGIVTVDRGQYWLVLADGRRMEARALPAELRTKNGGARVFLAGPLDRAPVAYGVIQEVR